jgi:hypothetical protein
VHLRELLAETAPRGGPSAAAWEGRVRVAAAAAHRRRRRTIVTSAAAAALSVLMVGPGLPDGWVPADLRSPAATAVTPTPSP